MQFLEVVMIEKEAKIWWQLVAKRREIGYRYPPEPSPGNFNNSDQSRLS